jgi:DNA repair photolyase
MMQEHRDRAGQPRSPRPGDRVDAALPGLIPAGDLLSRTASLPPGIARQASLAPEIDERNEVSYSLLPSKSLLARCDSPRVPFEWSINPYRGCEHACPYCYARYTHEFMELDRWQDFERKIFVKAGAAEVLADELRRNRRPGERLAIGTATDPYQPAERRYGVTRSILELLARYEDLQLSITTKSDLILRDLELLRRISERSDLRLNLTVTTLDRRLARILEPRAVRPDRRLRAVEQLAGAGLRVAVFLMPVMPRLNDTAAGLEEVIGGAAAAGARTVVSQVLFLRACSRKRFFPWLQEHFPTLLPEYRRLYGDFPGPLEAYTRQVLAEIQRLKEKHGLDTAKFVSREGIKPPAQAALDLE